MKRVLVTNLIMLRDLEVYQPQMQEAGVELVPHPVQQFLTEEELLPIIGEFDGIIAGDDQYTERVLRAGSPRLKVISKWGVGLDAIDLVAAEKLGIRVYNSPGAFSEAVSEVAICYMLMLTRKTHSIDRAVRRGEWPKPEGEGLYGATLGLVGYGGIGRAIANRARAFGMEVLATDVRMTEMQSGAGVRFVEFEDILSQADFLCLSCNLTPENRGMIGERELARMKPTAYLVNVARGALVDEGALIQALAQGSIAGAALDVYETEPLPAGHPLTRMENVVLGSHNANNVRLANELVNDNTIRNLLYGLGIIEERAGGTER